MSIRQPFRRGLIACVLLSTALSSAALTLGRSRGVALVGRPLDVAIPLTLDNAGQASELCAEADVFHGDSRVDASRVMARVEPLNGENAVVRIRSSVAVDEPVVTIYLRLGCKEKFTRRYVLLAEEPEITPSVGALAPAAAPVPAPAPAPARVATPATGIAAATAPAAAARPVIRSRRAAEAPLRPRGAAVGKLESTLAQPRSQPAARATTRAGRPRLTVDIVDLTPERDPQLRPTAGLSGPPSGNEQERAQAAALWRSINAQPQDVLRDLQRVQALENDLKGLRGVVAGNDRTLSELREQLNQARQERSLTLAAITLLALLLAAMAVSWWLRRGERAGSGEWWRRRDTAAQAGAGSPAAAGPAAPGSPPGGGRAMDLRVDESMFESLKKAPRVPVLPSVAALARSQAAKPAPPPIPSPTRPPVVAERSTGPLSSFHASFQSSTVASMRMVKAEELVDIQQQADFFMSLGQTEQAIEVLESHIQHNSDTSALVWLDLLAIYRALKRRQDYELLRGDFQRVFNAEVPTYDSTPTVSGGLEDYPRALSRITALWPSPKVMDVIEESIFRKPGINGGEPFDLEAYRELVLLYNLGREVVRLEAVASGDDPVSESPRSSFSQTSMQPLSVARHGAPPSGQDSMLHSDLDSSPGQTGLGEMVDLDSMLPDSDVDELGPMTTGSEFLDPQVPRPSPRLGLDIDLTAPGEPGRHPALDSNSIDFELSEPDHDSESGRPTRPE